MAKLTIHFDTGKFYIAPLSGRHTVCACGQWLQDNVLESNKRKTTNPKEVTCKRCKKKLVYSQCRR